MGHYRMQEAEGEGFEPSIRLTTDNGRARAPLRRPVEAGPAQAERLRIHRVQRLGRNGDFACAKSSVVCPTA